MGDLRRFEGANLSSGKGQVYIRAGISDIGLIWQRSRSTLVAEVSRTRARTSAIRRGTVDHPQGCAGVVAGRTIGDQGVVRLPYITRNNVRKSKNGGRGTGQLSRVCKDDPRRRPAIAQEMDGRKEIPWALCRTPKQPRSSLLACELSLGPGDMATNSCTRLCVGTACGALPFFAPLSRPGEYPPIS